MPTSKRAPTRRTRAVPPSRPRTAQPTSDAVKEDWAAKIRQLAQRAIETTRLADRCPDDISPELEALILLRRLEPGQPEMAARCHAVLLRTHIDEMSSEVPLPLSAPEGLLVALYNFLDEHGWEYGKAGWAPGVWWTHGAGAPNV